ncbi:MAG: tail fiber domain-containing protein [bacterium]|nr:tail fiber domain-containing protein [bacterium]
MKMANVGLCASVVVVTTMISVAAQRAMAQEGVPLLINYQGDLGSPSTGEPVPDGDYDMVFRIYDVPGGGEMLWTGTHSTANGNAVAVSDGIFSVILGSGTGNALDASAFSEADRWLEIQVGAEVLSPRQRMTSVAYSIIAHNSRLLGGNEASDFVIQAQGLRLQPNATSPNLIAGHEDNAVTDGVAGATVGGGGSGFWPNSVTDNFGTVGGGADNRAGDNAGTASDAAYATVGGGLQNTASGDYATVSGGRSSTAGANYATVAGGYSNTASGSNATVAGGSNITASGSFATVAGGYGITASGSSATVAGGYSNAASGDYATVGGGYSNQATADYATIAGGGRSDPGSSSTANRVKDSYGTIGGGGNNQAGDDDPATNNADYATVGGGRSNEASDRCATIGGGSGNLASGLYSVVAGGAGNDATGNYSFVGGGNANEATKIDTTVGGGVENKATGEYSTIGGGWFNEASGQYATIPGGDNNDAQGNYSFAAGRRAKANDNGCFVWGDSYAGDVASTASNQFIARASGGVWFYSNTALTAGARLSAGSSSWSSVSDKGLKRNIRQVDGREILSKLTQIPISRWSYKAQAPAIEHVGPMAQDFYAGFGVGEDDKHISTVDADGVALAAIQGLHEMLREKDAEIAAIKNQNAELQQRLSALEKLFEKFSQER